MSAPLSVSGARRGSFAVAFVEPVESSGVIRRVSRVRQCDADVEARAVFEGMPGFMGPDRWARRHGPAANVECTGGSSDFTYCLDAPDRIPAGACKWFVLDEMAFPAQVEWSRPGRWR